MLTNAFSSSSLSHHYLAPGCSRWYWFPSSMPPNDPHHSDDDAYEEEGRDTVGHLPQRPFSERVRHAKPVTPQPRKAVSGTSCSSCTLALDVTHHRWPSEMTTPLRGSMEHATKSQSGFLDPLVKDFLKRHFRGTIIRGCLVPTFIHAVWKFDVGKIKYDKDHSFSLPLDYCKEYIETTWKDDSTRGRREASAAMAFTNIWDHLASQLQGKSGGMKFMNLQDRIVQGTYARYKPDFAGVSAGAAKTWEAIHWIHWSSITDGGEMKKYLWDEEKKMAYEYKTKIDIDLIEGVSAIVERTAGPLC